LPYQDKKLQLPQLRLDLFAETKCSMLDYGVWTVVATSVNRYYRRRRQQQLAPCTRARQLSCDGVV